MWRGSPGSVWGRGLGTEMDPQLVSFLKVQKSMFQVACKGSHLLPGALFQGARPCMGWQTCPWPHPLPTNGQACGWLLLKGQALASPGLVTTVRDPRGQMGSWRLSLPEDGILSGLVSLACVGGPTSPPSGLGLAPLLALLSSGWCCRWVCPTQMAPKSESCFPAPSTP